MKIRLGRENDAEAMFGLYLHDLEKDMGKAKAEIVSMLAKEKRAKRELEECEADVEKMYRYAKQALMSDNESEARQFLVRRKSLMEKQRVLQQNYETVADNVEKMCQAYNALAQEMDALNGGNSSD